jgi:hypothetical protein
MDMAIRSRDFVGPTPGAAGLSDIARRLGLFGAGQSTVPFSSIRGRRQSKASDVENWDSSHPALKSSARTANAD